MDARIMFVWVSKVAPVYSSPTPYSFRFGTFKAFKHLKMLVETSFPTLLIKNPHKAVPRSAGEKRRQLLANQARKREQERQAREFEEKRRRLE